MSTSIIRYPGFSQKKSCYLPFLVILISQVSGWTHHLVLDPESKVHLFWTPDRESITFELQVETHGYVAIGFSPNGGMAGADVFLCWILPDGKIIAHDRYASDTLTPDIDPSQDYFLLDGYENDTHTVVKFMRNWDTCDEKDFPLTRDTTRLIWSYHPEDPSSKDVLPYHGRLTRGVKSVYLMEQPDEIKMEHVHSESSVKAWDIRSRNTMLPNDDHTHYWCQIFKAPDLKGVKHHMIGFEPLIQNGHENYVHHMVLYECHVHGEGQSSDWFQQHIGLNRGEKCYSPNMPPEWTFCLATNTWAWAVGSEGEFLPDHVGIPLGEEFGGATYFMLETHYDNPSIQQNIVDNSGLRIFYTPKLRQFDAGMLLLGSEVNFLHMIPPMQDLFTTAGRCSSDCTRKGMGPDGIEILSGVLHSHLAGRKMRLRHIRGDQEQPVILEDNNYDFNFQASRKPKNVTVVRPGDDLILECEYSTKNRKSPTFGGLSTREEMCLAFIHYYPRVDLADCRSLPSLNTVMKAFGINSIYGKSFEKLAIFMKDIEGSEDSGTSLKELLQSLAKETGYDLSPSHFQLPQPRQTPKPLTEEDILNQPFYVVEPDPSVGNHMESPEKDYRNLLSDMLLSIRIKSPRSLHNKTIGEHLSTIDWSNPKAGNATENIFRFGSHNSLCLAHGRYPLTEYKEITYPDFKPWTDPTRSQCRGHYLKIKKTDESDGDSSFESEETSIRVRNPHLRPKLIPFTEAIRNSSHGITVVGHFAWVLALIISFISVFHL